MGNKQARARNLSPQTLKELQDNVEVDFSTEEIRTWYKEFKGSCSAGESNLTKKEFKKVYNSLFKGDASDFAEQVFRTFDKDGNGTVDFNEFIVGLCVSGSSDTDTKLQWAFNMYDINGDGFIDKGEMVHIFSAILNMTRVILPEDVNTPEKMTDKVFLEFDLNNDQRISKTEFMNCALKNRLVLDMLQCDPEENGNGSEENVNGS